MPWVDLQCLIVVFPDHTHFFGMNLFFSLKAPAYTLKTAPVTTAHLENLTTIQSNQRFENCVIFCFKLKPDYITILNLYRLPCTNSRPVSIQIDIQDKLSLILTG